MSASWKTLCREAGLKYQGDTIRVRCGAERFQEVFVDDSRPDVLRIWSRVAAGRRLAFETADADRPEVEAWRINRYRELAGFKVAERGAIIGEAWIPLIDLTPGEWQLYVTTVARACDRLEYLWTGKDEW